MFEAIGLPPNCTEYQYISNPTPGSTTFNVGIVEFLQYDSSPILVGGVITGQLQLGADIDILVAHIATVVTVIVGLSAIGTSVIFQILPPASVTLPCVEITLPSLT